MANDMLGMIVSLSVQGAVAGLLVMALRGLLGRRLPVKWRYFLWVVVLVKFCLPINIASPLSVFNLFNRSGPAAALVNNTVGISLARPESDAEGGVYRLSAISNAPADTPSVTEALPLHEEAFFDKAATLIHPETVIITVLFLVSAMLLLRALWKYLNLKIQIYKWRRENVGTPWHDLSRLCLLQAGLSERQEIDAVFTHAARSPYTFGFFNPIVVLPAALADGDEKAFRAVVYHEGIHIRQNHHRIKFLTMLIQCVFWYNPFVYLFNAALNADIEMDCDDRVLALMDEHGQKLLDRVDYVNALVYVASIRQTRFSPVAAFTENGLKHRVQRILEGSPMNKFFMALSAVLATALCVVLMTGANPTAKKNDSESLTPAAEVFTSTESNDAMPQENSFTFAEALEALERKVNAEPSGSMVDAASFDWFQKNMNGYQWDYTGTDIEGLFYGDNMTAPTLIAAQTDLIDMAAIQNIVVEAACTSVRFVEADENQSYAVFACNDTDYAKQFQLIAEISDDGHTLFYRLKRDAHASDSKNSARSLLTLYLPDKVYDSLSASASASAFNMNGLRAGYVSLNGSASSFNFCDNEAERLEIDLSASSIHIGDNELASLCGNINACSLSADFETLDFNMTLEANASSLSVQFENVLTDAFVDIHATLGAFRCPDAWKNASGAQWEENKLGSSSLDVTLGEGRNTLKIDASASSMNFTQGQ